MFGQLVKDTRIALGWSQGDLARRVDYAQQSISRIEAGTQDPLPRDVIRIADVLGIHRGDALVAAEWIGERDEVLSREDWMLTQLDDDGRALVDLVTEYLSRPRVGAGE